MSTEYDSFVFTHIPKCGGSSFRKLIYQSAINSKISEDQIYIPGEGKVKHDANLNQLDTEQLSALQKQKVKILADHTKFLPETYKALGMQNPFVFTIFRNPKQRFISHYNFFYKKVGLGNCKGVAIKDLPEQKLIRIIKTLSNVQCAYILGIKPGETNTKEIRLRFDEILNKISTNRIHFGK